MKYNKIQLRKMARHLLAIKDRDRGRYMDFILKLTQVSGKDIICINAKIKLYATRGKT